MFAQLSNDRMKRKSNAKMKTFAELRFGIR